MSKKSSTIIISIICVVTMLALIIGILVKDGIITEETIFTNHNVQGNSTVSTSQNTTDNESTTNNKYTAGYPVFAVLLEEGAEYPVQYTSDKYEAGEYRDILVKFNQMSISKEKGNFDICSDWDEKKNSEGTIINGYSYVSLDVTLVNQGEYSHEVSLNSLYLLAGSEYSYELRSYNSEEANPQAKNYFIVTLEPDTEYHFTFAYIAEDQVIKENLSELYLYASFLSFNSLNNENNQLPLIKKGVENE